MSGNQLCGIGMFGGGTYTAEGITKLCEALKGSAVTALKYGPALESSPFCQHPLTRLLSHYPHPSLAVSNSIVSETRAPPRSLPSSRRR